MANSVEERGEYAVACSLSRLPDGRLRVILDDVKNLALGQRGPWQHDAFVTSKDYEQSELSALELSEEEFASFGHYVLTRLLVANQLLA